MEVIQKTYISRMTKWANEMERALHALTGEGGFYPPYAFPSVIRGYKTKPVVIPDKKDVSPELLSDIQAVIDECNAAITETFSDAPAKFSANDMPGIILAHVLAGGSSSPWALIAEATVTVTANQDVLNATASVFPGEVAPSDGYSVLVSDIPMNYLAPSSFPVTGAYVIPWFGNGDYFFTNAGRAHVQIYKVTI